MIRLLGAILQAIGLLIAGASGLCSAWFTVAMGTSGGLGSDPGILLLIALFGGIPSRLALACSSSGSGCSAGSPSRTIGIRFNNQPRLHRADGGRKYANRDRLKASAPR
jgi:hypothetical protein